MAEERIQRKLTTILAADVEGYTRLMRADEEATLKTLGEYREIIDGLIARHDGRVFRGGGGALRHFMPGRDFEPQCRVGGRPEIDVPHRHQCR